MITLGEVHTTGGEGRRTGKAYTATAHGGLSPSSEDKWHYFSARNKKASSEAYFEIILNKTPKEYK